MTWGEELFLNLYDDLGVFVSITGPQGIGLDFLIDKSGFENFSRLSATYEVFIRCVRSAASTHHQMGNASAEQFARHVRTDVDLPPRLFDNKKFSERLKQTGRIAAEGGRDERLERSATKDHPPICYLCGVALTKTGALTGRSIDHVWPLSLGGETIESNLLLACKDCNSKRGHLSTWAVGPVQSTYYVQSSGSAKLQPPNASVRFSLALARMIDAARPTRLRKHPLTLKEAALAVRPAVPMLKLTADRPYLYFELIKHLEISV